MRILEISAAAPFKKNSGGAEKFCFDLSKRLAEKGLQIEIAVPGILASLKGIRLRRIHTVKNKYLRKVFFDYFNPYSFLRIKKMIRDFEPDIIHFHNTYGLGSFNIRRISKSYPVLMTVHDLWLTNYSEDFSFINKIHTSILLNSFEKVVLVSPSKFIADELRKTGYENVKVIHNGVAVSSKKKTYNKTPKFLYVGSLSENKGIRILVDLFSKNNIGLTVVGAGPLLSYVRTKKNIFVIGYDDNPERHYLDHDILIVPSIVKENQPTVVLEAMSYGLALIASNIGGIPELIEHKKTGLLFNHRDENDLRNQLDFLINCPEEIRKMGERARERVRKEFNWDETVASYLTLYQDLVRK